jgi:nitroreductase
VSDTLTSIAARRSIRRYSAEPVAQSTIAQLLLAAQQAPSAKNAQPWRFVVLQGSAALELADIMKRSAAERTAAGVDVGSLPWSAAVIEQAPVTILVLNAAPPADLETGARDDYQFVMIQSTGAAIENMLLAAQAMGLGSLWICDVLYCAPQILAWLAREQQTLVAAIALGHAAEAPGARPRIPWEQLTEWRGAPAAG